MLIIKAFHLKWNLQLLPNAAQCHPLRAEYFRLIVKKNSFLRVTKGELVAKGHGKGEICQQKCATSNDDCGFHFVLYIVTYIAVFQ